MNARTVASTAAVVTAMALSLSAARATVILSDLNSTASIDPNSQAGMNSWIIQGANELYQQWFWYRVGTNAEQSIDTISAPTITNFAGTRGVTISYGNAQLTVKIDYLLTGSNPVSYGQTAIADIAETISITNNSNAPLDFHFFQYSDFDLNGVNSDTVQLGTNLFGKYNEAFQQDGSGSALTETVITPGANRGEVDLFANTLGRLNDAVATNLNNVAGPVGPGDTTWALQWDWQGANSLPAGSTVIISKDKQVAVVVTPEPATLAILPAAGILLALRRRR